MIRFLKLKRKTLSTESKKPQVLRRNLKITWDFWAFKPYKEVLQYVIDSHEYRPVSSRFLCFSFTVVRESDLFEREYSRTVTTIKENGNGHKREAKIIKKVKDD